MRCDVGEGGDVYLELISLVLWGGDSVNGQECRE